MGSVALFLATPFLAFPEIMGDQGPRNIPLWRDFAGIFLFAISGMGAVVSLKWWLRERRTQMKLDEPLEHPTAADSLSADSLS
jgi:hypothetical protein